MAKFKITDILPNENNPRYIRDDKFEKLVTSIITFPEMMSIRPIVVDELNISLGGNMRYEGCKEIQRIGEKEVTDILKRTIKQRNGSEESKLTKEDEKVIQEKINVLKPLFKGEFPNGWIHQELNLTKEQKRELILKDNASYGEWDFDALANQYAEWELEEADIWTPLLDKDVDIDSFFESVEDVKEGKNKIVLKYKESEYNDIQDALSNNSQSKEDIFYNAVIKQ